jgi:PTS system glucose-specific IIA component
VTDVLSPCPGRVVAMADVPDPVFAEEMVGPGVAIEPDPGPTTVVAPIAGTVLKVLPHAFVVLGDGVGVLVHLGINTVRLEGEGFEVLATQGSEVAAGDPMITWDPAARTSRRSYRWC